MSLPEILTRLRGRKKPVRSTQTPTIPSISTSTAPAQLTDVIKKFNDNTEDTALALEALKTDVDTKTATTINLSPTAINLPAESTANVTLQVETLTLLPDGFVFEPPTPVVIEALADTDLIHVSQQADSGTAISLADFIALLPTGNNNSGSLSSTEVSALVTGYYVLALNSGGELLKIPYDTFKDNLPSGGTSGNTLHTISGVISSFSGEETKTLFTPDESITLVSYKIRWGYIPVGYYFSLSGVNQFTVDAAIASKMNNYVLEGTNFMNQYFGSGDNISIGIANDVASPVITGTINIPLYWEISYYKGIV